MSESGNSVENSANKSQVRSLLCFLLVSISAGIVYNASYVFLSSMTTTLERRFGFDSEDTGRIIVANDIGFAATVTLVSFYGNRGHRPRVLGLGAVVMGLSTAAYALPYFIYGPKYSEDEIARYLALTEQRDWKNDIKSAKALPVKNNDLLCREETYFLTSTDLLLNQSSESTQTSGSISISQTSESYGANQADAGNVVFTIFMLVGIVQGAASAPSWSVLFTMVEDSATAARSPIYIGLVITARSISPMLGYYLIGQFLALHESFGESGLRESDSLWIGNWWLGFLSLGLLTSLLGFPMLLFPRHLEDRVFCCSSRSTTDERKDDLDDAETDREAPEAGAPLNKTDIVRRLSRHKSCESQPRGAGRCAKFLHSLRDLSLAVKRTMTNAILMLVMLSCVVSLLGSGLEVLFIVKYYENYFNVLPSAAGQYVGITYALPTALATLAGGYIVSRLQLDVVGMMRLIFGIFLVATVLNSPAFFLDCPSERVNPTSLSEIVGRNVSSVSSCAAKCGCDATLVNNLPVCGADGNFYLSPCHAGCTRTAKVSGVAKTAAANGTKLPIGSAFSNCACLEQGFVNYSSMISGEQAPASTAQPGGCYGVCGMVYAFSVLKFIAHFVGGLSYVSWFLLVMRVTDSKDDEAMGVGIISLFFSLAASIMGGFCGRIYESACLVATSGSAGQRNCLLYDKTRLRILFNGIPMLARLPYFALLLAAYLLIKRRFGGTNAAGESGNDDENLDLNDRNLKPPDSDSSTEAATPAPGINEEISL